MKLIRIIPTLLAHKNFLVKGKNFTNHKYIGDVYNTVKIFSEKKAHEIFLIDIFASKENRVIDLDLIKKIKKEIFVPLCVGGGIHDADLVGSFIGEGVEKICINSELENNFNIIEKIASRFGSQSVVASIDVKKVNDNYKVCFQNGQKISNINLNEYIVNIQNSGIGEIVLTSIDFEGTKKGFDIDLYKAVEDIIKVPLIANGGANNLDSFSELFDNTSLSSASAGAGFVFYGERDAVLINYPTSNELEQFFIKYE